MKFFTVFGIAIAVMIADAVFTYFCTWAWKEGEHESVDGDDVCLVGFVINFCCFCVLLGIVICERIGL